MKRLSNLRSAPWLPGLAWLVLSAAASALIGQSLGLRQWWAYVGMAVAALLGIGAIERALVRYRTGPAPRRPRSSSKLKLIHGGKTAYDLEDDDSHKDQKYLM